MKLHPSYLNPTASMLCILAAVVALCGCSPPAPLVLTEIRTRSEKDNQGPWYIYGKVEETVRGSVVGLSWREESYTLADGSRHQVSSPWAPGDAAELTYGKPSLKVTTFGSHPHVPRHSGLPYASVRLRLRAAVAERIEHISIADFQLGKEYKVCRHGYTITASGEEGTAMGRDPATLIHCSIEWPPDYQEATQADVWVSWRLGFLGEDGSLITPSGAGGGFVYLGRNWAGKTLVFEVPVGIRLMETTVEIELP